MGLVEKIEEREIELPTSDRSKTPIEPFLTDQWFVKMDTLAQSAIDVVSDGSVKITPARYARGYESWLAEKRDWPVSRQLWWGHQIPVWSLACQSESDAASAMDTVKKLPAFDANMVSMQTEPSSEPDADKRKLLDMPEATVHVCVRDENGALESELLAAGFVREEDVLDTWFSSALWPHSTLGWPAKTPELDYFYQTQTLITSRDIITLWVARMVLMGLNNMGEIPFTDVYIHPKILDAYGETMSKSKGNGIDPLDIIEKFGADALRFAMATLTTETQDVRLPVQYECPHCEHTFEQTKKNRELPRVKCPNKKCGQEFCTQWAESDEDKALKRGGVTSERFETSRNFVNKLWNASRFAMLNLDDYSAAPIDEANLTVEDRWLLSRLYRVSTNVTAGIDGFKYSELANELYDFAWNDFCSFYVEILKNRLADPKLRSHAQSMLVYGLDTLLRLLHPLMPFITEEIWQLLSGIAPSRGFDAATAPECLIGAPWPVIDARFDSPEVERQFSLFQSTLGSLREIRNRQNLPPKQEIKFSIESDAAFADSLRPLSPYFNNMANATLVDMGPGITPPPVNATIVDGDVRVFVDLDGLIDKEAEAARLTKEIEKTTKNIEGKERKLSSEKFVSGAPEEIVQRERDGLATLKEQLITLQESLARMQS